MERPLITKSGYDRLKEEHQNLIKVERPKVIEAIEVARAHGDLKENAEYHAAREKQSFIEGRIQRLNHLLASLQVVEVTAHKEGKIGFGAIVTYRNQDTDEETTWQLVGEEETDIKTGRISVKSPIAQALMGKKQGDELVMRVPKGEIEVEITKVKYV